MPWESIAEVSRAICKLWYGRLLTAGKEFIQKHLEILDEMEDNRGVERAKRWLRNYLRRIEKLSEKGPDSPSPPEVMALSLWLFQLTGQMGVLAGIGPDGVKWCGNPPDEPEAAIPEWMDKDSTVKLLTLCAYALNVQFLPRKTDTAMLR